MLIKAIVLISICLGMTNAKPQKNPTKVALPKGPKSNININWNNQSYVKYI